MLTNQSLIYFAPEPWHGLWRNRQQLMSIFARHNKVLFVEDRFYLKEVVSRWRQGKLTLADLRRPSLQRLSDNLAILRYPIWAPVSGASPLRAITQRVRRAYLCAALNKLEMTAPIVWFSRPAMVDLVDEMPPTRLRIYHVVDEYGAYVRQTVHSRQRTEAQEQAMLAQVDLVFVVSEKLRQTKGAHHVNTHLVPNGVDYQLYQRALAHADLPPALAAIPAPRLGYIGLIGDKLDFTLLLALARHNPAWSLVFLGEANVSQQQATWAALRQMPNVYHLPAVHAQAVPDYVKGFTVGLMPYVRNEQAEHISPLKLYDYLAAGLPVVSVPIPAARLFADSIHLADTPGHFIEAVQQAMTEQHPAQQAARRALAAQHTWEQRAEQISTLIQNQLIPKPSRPDQGTQQAPLAGQSVAERWRA